MTVGDITTERVTKNRIYDLFELFKEHPIHQIYKIFKDRYNVGITVTDLEKIYQIWRADHTYPKSVPLRKLQKTDWWPKIETKIKKQTAQDISDFIYNHWKRAGNK